MEQNVPMFVSLGLKLLSGYSVSVIDTYQKLKFGTSIYFKYMININVYLNKLNNNYVIAGFISLFISALSYV